MKDGAGYVSRPLGEVCTLQRGFDLPTEQRVAGKFPLVTSSGPTDTHCEARVRGPGVVTGRSGSIGSVYFIAEDFWPLNTALYIKDFHGNDERYVFYLLQAFDLSRFSSGAGVPTLNRNHVHDELVRVTSDRAEQKRIVAKLDQAFAALDRARANAEANLADADGLLSSALGDAFGDETAPEVEMRTLFSVGSSKRVLKSQWKSSGVPFYRGREVTKLSLNGAVENDLFISEEHFAELKMKYGVPVAGDIVITAIGTIGNAHVVLDSDRFYFKDASVLWMKKIANVSSEYVLAWLKSPRFFEQLDTGNGATVDTLTIQKLQSMRIRVLSIEDQCRVVSKLGSLRAEVSRLRADCNRKLADLAALRQSLLQAAFSGQLS